MNRRRLIVIGAVAASVVTKPLLLSAQTGVDDTSVRKAIAEYESVRNRHDVQAWAERLTSDIEFIWPGGRDRGREAVSVSQEQYVKGWDQKIELRRLRMEPNGTATAVMRVLTLKLPLRDGQYQGTMIRDAVVTRWRLEGGEWRWFYFNNVAHEAQAIVKDEGLE
jgi:ketosteroid isomerase-like protein